MVTPVGYVRAEDLPVLSTVGANDFTIGIADVGGSPYLFRTPGGGGGGGSGSISIVDGLGGTYLGITQLTMTNLSVGSTGNGNVDITANPLFVFNEGPVSFMDLDSASFNTTYDSVNQVLTLSSDATLNAIWIRDEGSNAYGKISSLNFRQADGFTLVENSPGDVSINLDTAGKPGEPVFFGGTFQPTIYQKRQLLIANDVSTLVLTDSSEIEKNLNFIFRNDHIDPVPVNTINGVTLQPAGLTQIAAGASVEFFFDVNSNTWRAVGLSGTFDQLATITTISLAPGASQQGLLTMGRANCILNVTTSAPARVRFYATTAYGTADLARAFGTAPTGEHGVLFDVATTAGNLSFDCAPLSLVAPVAIGSNRVPFTISNTGTASAAITVNISYLAL